jgi:hypothetical protein
MVPYSSKTVDIGFAIDNIHFSFSGIHLLTTLGISLRIQPILATYLPSICVLLKLRTWESKIRIVLPLNHGSCVSVSVTVRHHVPF